jgi:hypothetical protein
MDLDQEVFHPQTNLFEILVLEFAHTPADVGQDMAE